MMTHRQRALITLKGGQTDYVPTFELVFHETERDFGGRTFYGVPFEPGEEKTEEQKWRHNAELYVDVARRFEHALILVSPLGWPFVDHYEEVVGMIRMIRERSGEEFCVLSHGDPTFKIPSDPVGFAERMYDDPAGVMAEAAAKVEAMLPAYDAVMEAGADGVVMTSDYAFNSGTFLSPEQFGDFVTPYLARAIAEVRARGGVVIKHSDGDLMGVIDQIVQAEPDGLHSIDPMAEMDIKVVKQRYGARVCLCGNVHCAWLQTGTEEQIRGSAAYCMEHGKPGGGYFFSTSNCVFRGMPLASYDVIMDVWRKGRGYGVRGE